MSIRALPVLIVALAATLIAFVVVSTERGVGPVSASAQDPARTVAREELRGRMHAEHSDARAQPERNTPQAATALAEFDLIAALRALGELDGLLDPRIAEFLRPLLAVPENAWNTIALLRDKRLAGHPWTPAARGGAVIALTVAAAVYADPPVDGELAGLGFGDVDGRAFVLALLDDLHAFAPLVRERIVQSLRTVRVEGRLVLDVTYLDAILQLRAAHPEARTVYGELLHLIAEDLGPADRAALHTLFLSETDDPTLMKVALANLLQSEDGAHYVQLAGSLLAEGALAAAARTALLNAVAASAPVADAARMLADHAGSIDGSITASLGLREGGAAALGAEYTRLVVSNSDAHAREVLVAGLTFSGDVDTLAGIATTDPEVRVRGQALMSLTASQNSDPVTSLAVLETGWRERDDPLLGIQAAHATLAAGNLVGDLEGPARERALGILFEVARGTSSSSQRALLTLRRHLPANEYTALETELGSR